jgi:NAD(P)-dependent dehydrogenase (short-subunit alcohol dehydrogenase family)
MASTTTNKTVFITGAASGIGRATAQLFASHGYRVAALDLEKSDLDGTLQSLAHPELKHAKYSADVSSSAQMQKVFAAVESDFGVLNAAVNNAGVDGGFKRFLDNEEEDFDKTINVNLKGVFLCLKHELRMMSKQKSGSIVNLSSVFGHVGAHGVALYAASKHGVLGMTRSLAIEFAKKGIRINAVCPGGVDTAMIQRARDFNPKLVETMVQVHPVGRLAAPEEIAKAIYWLCSDDSSFVMGSALTIDGAFTAG